MRLLIFISIIFLSSIIGLCQGSNSDSLNYQYKVLTSQLDSLQFLLDSISNRSDSLFRLIIEPKKTTLTKPNYSQINEKRQSFQNRYSELSKNKNFPTTLPVDLDDLGLIVGFGNKLDPWLKRTFFHEGIDLPISTGSLAKSTINGTVHLVEVNYSGYGKHVIVNSEFGIQVLYAHLDSVFVKNGEKVLIGAQIGMVGNSGKSSRSHLHYEIMINGELINPIWTIFHLLKEEDIDYIFGGNDQTYD